MVQFRDAIGSPLMAPAIGHEFTVDPVHPVMRYKSNVCHFTYLVAVIVTAVFGSNAVGDELTPSKPTILGEYRQTISFFKEFDELTCPLNIDGGMLTELVNEAMETVVLPQDFIVDFAGSGRDAILKHEAKASEASLSFPFYRPNCGEPVFLTEETRRQCNNYEWSDPIYGIFVGMFRRKTATRIFTRYHHAYGTRLCISGAALPKLLRERGITALNTKIVEEFAPEACLAKLASGEVDLAQLPIFVAENRINNDPNLSQVMLIEDLAVWMSIHAIAPKGNPSATRNLAALNLGLRNLRRTEDYYKIVLKHHSGHSHDHPYSDRGEAFK